MTEDQLFSEDINDALRDVIRALGGMKAVAARLRPELGTEAAAGWLKDCLNPSRRERLNPEQVLWLLREGRKVGCHSLMNYLCDEASYCRAQPLEPHDEAAELRRQVVASVKHFEGLVKRLERLNGST
jgi:hypothetical protein